MIKKFLISFLTILVSCFSFLVSPAFAQCPVCIVTVGGGMLIAQKLGIDDFLVSIWISALNTAISFWLAQKIKIKILKNGHILSILMLATVLAYFRFTDEIGVSGNTLLGIDKIIFGSLVGLLAMGLGNHTYIFTKAKNGGKTIFPYAKVAFPLGFVLVVTLIFKAIFKL